MTSNPCSFCLPGREKSIETWPKENRAGLVYILETFPPCEAHKKQAEEKLRSMPKVLVVKNGPTPSSFMPKPVAATRSFYEREPGEDG